MSKNVASLRRSKSKSKLYPQPKFAIGSTPLYKPVDGLQARVDIKDSFYVPKFKQHVYKAVYFSILDPDGTWRMATIRDPRLVERITIKEQYLSK